MATLEDITEDPLVSECALGPVNLFAKSVCTEARHPKSAARVCGIGGPQCPSVVAVLIPSLRNGCSDASGWAAAPRQLHGSCSKGRQPGGGSISLLSPCCCQFQAPGGADSSRPRTPVPETPEETRTQDRKLKLPPFELPRPLLNDAGSSAETPRSADQAQ